MKALCETLGVSRSRQYEKCQEGTRLRRRHYRRAEDDFYLVLIREIVNHRVTSGYRRVTAHLNRMLHGHGHVPVNPKRVYRLMKIGGLLLQRSTGHSSRVHEGTIVTTRSNLRWCSDFSRSPAGARNGSGWLLLWNAAIGRSSVMWRRRAESTEARHGLIDRLPEPIEWLSDNGPAYIARETVAFAESVGFIVCTTPFYSPESNGMAEAFVKTFKRDYVHVNPLHDARFVLAQLPKWFEDYNEFHPHKGLKMKSPREYRRLAAKLETCPVN